MLRLTTKNASTAALAVRFAPSSAFTKETSFAEHILSNGRRLIFSVVLIFSLLAVGVSCYFIIESTREAGAAVIISLDGGSVAEYSLKESGEFSLNGGTNILVIEDGKAYIKSADCPDKTCVRQGKIFKTGERIVCLPNRLMVEVVGNGDEIFAN